MLGWLFACGLWLLERAVDAHMCMLLRTGFDSGVFIPPASSITSLRQPLRLLLTPFPLCLYAFHNQLRRPYFLHQTRTGLSKPIKTLIYGFYFLTKLIGLQRSEPDVYHDLVDIDAVALVVVGKLCH